MRTNHNSHWREDIAITFWSKVNQDGGVPSHKPELGPCWLWRDSPNSAGYGRISHDHNRDYAHRISWFLHYGEIPDGLFVLHKCDVRLCVRPDHLFLGDDLANMVDMWEKGRARPVWRTNGISHAAKLVPSQVREIRGLLSSGELPSTIGRRYHVHPDTIRKIAKGRSWADLQ